MSSGAFESNGRAKGRRVITLLCMLGALVARIVGAEEPRPQQWARRIESGEVPNLHQVSPMLYRSGQPRVDGFRELEKRGIRTVVSLVDDESDDAYAAGTKLRLLRVPVSLTGISDDSMIAALRMLAKKEDGPFLVHCLQGADRTGAVIAMHRILVEGWTKDAALRELRDGGYGFGLEVFAKYVEGADVARLRARLAEPKK
jgi:protein tyrosine/serine phosphatase